MTTNSACAITYSGDGTTTVFPFSFLVKSVLDLQVLVTDTTQTPVVVTILQPAQYGIAGIGNPAGGNVTYPLTGSPLAVGWTVTLRQAVQVPIGCGTDPANYLTTILTAENAAVASAAACAATSDAGQASTSANTAASAATAAGTAAADAAASAAAMAGTSTTAVAVATGAQTVTTQAGKYFNPGTWLLMASTADPANFLHGQVTAYAATTLSVDVIDTGGAGTHADWIITVSGTRGPQGAQGPQGVQGAAGPQGAQGPAGPGSVTSVTAGNGLTGGTITTTGTLAVQAADATILVDGSGIRVNAGTGAGQIVQLDSNGRLPALDASQVINVASTADIVALEQDIIQNYLLDAINGAWAAGQYSDGGYDAFNSDTLSGVNGTGGQTYDDTNRLYGNPGVTYSRVATATASSSLANSTSDDTAKFNDNNVSTAYGPYIANLSGVAVGNRIYAQLDLGSVQTVTKLEALSMNSGGAGYTTALQFMGGTSSDPTTWSNLGSAMTSTTGTATYTSVGSWSVRYVAIICVSSNYAEYLYCQDFNAYVAGAVPDMTLVGAALNPPPATAPSSAQVMVLWKDLSGYSRLNTDFTAEITGNGGTNWVPATLVNTGLTIGGFGVLTATVPLASGGTTVQYRLKTLNSRSQQVKAVGLMTQ